MFQGSVVISEKYQMLRILYIETIVN